MGGNDAAQRGLAWTSSRHGIPPPSFTPRLVAGSARSSTGASARDVGAGADHVIASLTADDPLVPFGKLAQEFAGYTPRGAHVGQRTGAQKDVRGNG
ncbi:MAG TPA: hypothetical protein VED63_02535 [Acidimicrobiales bacterium]|nr:hypothetical protein [Acidimicrobiales bacterium]